MPAVVVVMVVETLVVELLLNIQMAYIDGPGEEGRAGGEGGKEAEGKDRRKNR